MNRKNTILPPFILAASVALSGCLKSDSTDLARSNATSCARILSSEVNKRPSLEDWKSHVKKHYKNYTIHDLTRELIQLDNILNATNKRWDYKNAYDTLVETQSVEARLLEISYEKKEIISQEEYLTRLRQLQLDHISQLFHFMTTFAPGILCGRNSWLRV